MKELKDIDNRAYSVKASIVESGEGIESQSTAELLSQLLNMWNPVKELKARLL